MGLVLRHPSGVSAAMGAVSACDPDRAAVVDREPLPCDCGAWGCALARAGKLPPHHPAHPMPAACGHRQGSPTALGPTQIKAGIAGKYSPPHRSEDLVGEDLGWLHDRGFGLEGGLGRWAALGSREDSRMVVPFGKCGALK